MSVLHLQIFLPALLPTEQTEQRVGPKTDKSNIGSETIKRDIRLVQNETGNTTELPKSSPTLEQLGLYWLLQGPNTVWSPGTNVKGKYLHENSATVRDFT